MFNQSPKIYMDFLNRLSSQIEDSSVYKSLRVSYIYVDLIMGSGG